MTASGIPSLRSMRCLRVLACAGALLVSGHAARAESSPEELVHNLFASKLQDARVDPVVLALPHDRFAVTLTGEVSSADEKSDLERLARRIKPAKVDLYSKLSVKQAPPADTYEFWQLTYVPSRLTPLDPPAASPAGAAPPDRIKVLVETLNAIYGTADKHVVEDAGGGRLLLRGPEATVIEVKRFLARVDSPWPQVQMNMWAVQVSGSPASVARRIDEIGTAIREVHDDTVEVLRELETLTGDHPDRSNSDLLTTFDLAPDSPLSLNEALILLTLGSNREGVVRRLQRFTQDLIGRPEFARFRSQMPPAPGWRPFHRLEDALDRNAAVDQQGFREFGKAVGCFKARDGKARADAPRLLVRTGATLDRVLKSVMDAFAADMDDLFLQPLLKVIEQTAPLERGDGISLVGRTRIVVTSGLESKLDPKLATYVETTRPKPFGKDLLDAAFPAGKSSDKGSLTGATRVLANLPDGQAALLAAALMSETEPTFSTVAPGIAIHVQPTVLPDGGAARLKIDARFGVTSTPTSTQTRDDVWSYPPPPGVSSHEVATDAVVDAFDLFDISSFSVESSSPQAPFYVPILGRLPIIGRAFQFPRKNKVTHFESLVLVNTVILPRSVALTNLYSRDLDSKAKANCRDDDQAAGAPPLVAKTSGR